MAKVSSIRKQNIDDVIIRLCLVVAVPDVVAAITVIGVVVVIGVVAVVKVFVEVPSVAVVNFVVVLIFVDLVLRVQPLTLTKHLIILFRGSEHQFLNKLDSYLSSGLYSKLENKILKT